MYEGGPKSKQLGLTCYAKSLVSVRRSELERGRKSFPCNVQQYKRIRSVVSEVQTQDALNGHLAGTLAHTLTDGGGEGMSFWPGCYFFTIARSCSGNVKRG